MDCKVAVAWIHDYLDGDLRPRETEILSKHMSGCPDCRGRFDELQRVEALVRLAPAPAEAAPQGLEERVLALIPKRKRPAAWTGWVRRHPAVSAAALFLVVMLSSFVAMWNQDKQLSVSGADLGKLVIEGHTVIVPEGQQIAGDLTIVNGTAKVLGDVQGDLTVIDGNIALASTAHISGNVKKIDRAVDWAWYKVSSWFGSLAYGS